MNENLARTAYEAYAAHAGGSLVSGDKLPAFDDLPPRIRDAWDAAAQAAIDAAPVDLTDLADWTELTGQLAGAREQLGQVADAASVVLDAFTPGSDGYRARLSGVTLMRAYKAIGRPVPDRLKHLEGQ